MNKKSVQIDELTEIEEIVNFRMEPASCLCQVAVSARLSLRKITKMRKFYPFKMQIVQDLSEGNSDRRLEFGKSMTQVIIAILTLVETICFSNDTLFFLNKHLNKHNVRYWSDKNPRIVKEEHIQNPQKKIFGQEY